MKAEYIDACTGDFVVRVNTQTQYLSAGFFVDPATGESVEHQWLPCDHCLTLCRVPLNVVSHLCSDECMEKAEAQSDGPSEIPGYSHACGYHN
jgi:hypothetical protein